MFSTNENIRHRIKNYICQVVNSLCTQYIKTIINQASYLKLEQYGDGNEIMSATVTLRDVLIKSLLCLIERIILVAKETKLPKVNDTSIH